MKRNQHVDLGLYRRGLGRIVDASSDADISTISSAEANNIAEDYMVSAKDVYPFGQESWKGMRGTWQNYIYGQSNSSHEINLAIIKDTKNVSYTDWSNTFLGQWISNVTTAVWKNIGWWPADAKSSELQTEAMLALGNLMALYAYKQRNLAAFNAASQQLSSNQSRMPVCYLDTLGIQSNYGFQSYNLQTDGFAIPILKYSPVATKEQKEETPNNLVKPVSPYYKIEKTSVRVRKSPSTLAEIVKVVNGPLSALVTTNTEGWFGVNLSDGTSGWISSNLLKEISKTEYDKLVASEKGEKTAYTPPIKTYSQTSNAYSPPSNAYSPPSNDITPTDNIPVENTPIAVPKKDRAMMYIGIGAGVVAILGAILIIRTRQPESSK